MSSNDARLTGRARGRPAKAIEVLPPVARCPACNGAAHWRMPGEAATPGPACHECDCRSGSSVCRTDSRSWIAHGPPRTAADERGTTGSASKTPKTPPCRCRVGDKWCSIHDACRETGPNSFAMKPAGHRAHARGQRIRYPDPWESVILQRQPVSTQTVAFWTRLAQTIPMQTRFNRIENCSTLGPTLAKVINMVDETRLRRFAVLIDADTTSPRIAAGLFEEIAKFGEASARRIY